jgi:Bacterial nucleoid DNA-binding protein
MNKVELIEKMAAKAGMTKADARRALDAFMNTTEECLKKGDSLTLIGFGSFGVTKRAARKGHNPRKPQEIINIPAKKVVKFSAGATLKKAVNKK